MPRYHCLDTEVQLCTHGSGLWEPVFRDHQGLMAQSQTTNSPSSSQLRSASPKDEAVFPKESPPQDNKQVDQLSRLAEGYFSGCKGVDFIGGDVPFFLIHVGYDLSGNTDPGELSTGTKNSVLHGHKLALGSSEKSLRAQVSSRVSTIAKTMPSVPDDSPAASVLQSYENDLKEFCISSSGSSLSSLSSTNPCSPYANDFKLKEPNIEIGGQTTNSSVRLQAGDRSPKKHGLSLIPSRSQTWYRPIQVVVKVSEKSFIDPAFGGENNHCDICVNIFYNGEFNTSEIIKYDDWAAAASENHLRFGGRRIGTCHELPWIITSKHNNAVNSKSRTGIYQTTSTQTERWVELGNLLFLESNEWGKEENGRKCPTGKYLEILSTNTIPSELERLLVSTQTGFGVIDVVITIGRAFHNDFARDVTSPHRVLPPWQSLEPISSILPLPRMSHAVTVPSSQISSNTLGITAHTENTPLENAVFQGVVKRSPSISAASPVVLAKSTISRTPHPSRPGNVPQKRFRGNEQPVVLKSPPSKRQKTAKLFEELPFDLNAATYMSTRARRSASISFARTPPNLQLEISTKREQGVNQAECPSSKDNSLELEIAGSPLTPTKDKLGNPKTPVSMSSLKRKPRSSSYNPKLSNRPQNLRRKNSTGEWVIPPCRKNSLGEWETPIKSQQPKAFGLLGEPANGVSLEKNRKTFPPVFTLARQTRSQNTALGPRILDKTDQSISSDNSAEKINQVICPITDDQGKKERNRRVNFAAQKDEVYTLAACEKIKIPLKTMLRGDQKNNGKSQVPITSPKALRSSFEENFHKDEKNAMITVKETFARKKTIRMIFYEVNVNSAEAVFDAEHHKRRWLVRRCINPEYVSFSDANREPASSSPNNKSKVESSTSADYRNEEIATDALRVSTPAGSSRKPCVGNASDSTTPSNLVIANRRGNTVEASRQPQTPAVTKSRPRFVKPNYRPKVLRLVNRQSVATKMDDMLQDDQITARWITENSSVNLQIGGGADQEVKVASATNRPVLLTRGGLQNNPLPSEGKKLSSMAHLVENRDIIDSRKLNMISAQRRTLSGDNDSDAHRVQNDQANLRETTSTSSLKGQSSPKAVSPTEVKSLFESNGRHNAVNGSLDVPLRSTSSQSVPRASRKATLNEPRKIITSGQAVADALTSSDKLKAPIPTLKKGDSKKGGSSQHLTQETSNPPKVTQNMNKDADNEILEIVDSHVSSRKLVCSSHSYANDTSLCDNSDDTANMIVERTITHSYHHPEGGGHSPNNKSEALASSEAPQKPEKVVEINTYSNLDLDTQRTVVSNIKTAEESTTGVSESQKRYKSTPSVVSASLNVWKPNRLCEDSMLAYNTDQNLNGLERSPTGDRMLRRVKVQKEGHFKALGVLMGVRYVVVGSALAKGS